MSQPSFHAVGVWSGVIQAEVEMQRVHIQLERVQTWLFAVPRLRAMVGANARLGETLRNSLRELAIRGHAAGQWTMCPIGGSFPPADPDDPLCGLDDPARDAEDGILSRDGGHFEAQFEHGTEQFVEAAVQLLRRELPGLRYRVSISDGLSLTRRRAHLSTELPVLARCAWTGHGLASTIVTRGNPSDDDYEEHDVSLSVCARESAAGGGFTGDVAGQLTSMTRLAKLQQPQDLEDLVGNHYLALIHADGNGVGSALEKGASESERARFFHRNRVLLRRAVQAALNDDQYVPQEGIAPLIPLMLGGDDLLVVARAEIALPFVLTLCERLDELQRDSSGFKLTLGIGAVIAKRTVPIHRLHEIAEQLASSAKRRFRGFQDDQAKRSVVDWAVFNTTWVGDPIEVRRRDWLRCYRNGSSTESELCVLSQRPVDVLGKGLDSLQGLLARADVLERAPRSQLRFLVEQLSRGRVLSELAFQELSREAMLALHQSDVDSSPWARTSDGAWSTAVLDLMEIVEIRRLGRHVENNVHAMEAADG